MNIDYKVYRERKNALDKLYEAWLLKRFGTSNLWEIGQIFKHEYLSEHMDYVGDKPFKIGPKANEFDIEQLGKEVYAMECYYMTNPEVITDDE